MPDRQRDRARAGEVLRGAIESAARVGAGCVTLFAPSVSAGQSAGGTAAEMGEWLAPVADFAGEHGVRLAVENSSHFRRARDLWTLLEAVGHPAVAAGWDLVRATGAGEQPAVSVPTLNLRIGYVRVADFAGGVACRLGEGEVPVEAFVRRLKGVGYAGYLTVNFPAGVSEEVLADAVVKLKGWVAPQKAGGKPGAKGSGTVSQ
jgi:sugar phosphate isomerase/epimerase